MKSKLSILIGILLGIGLTAAGLSAYITQEETAALGGAFSTIGIIAYTVWSRYRETKRAIPEFTGNVAAKLLREPEAKSDEHGQPRTNTGAGNVPVLLLLALLATAITLSACTLTPAQKENVRAAATQVLTGIVKAGVSAGLNAIAANNPAYAKYITPLSAGFSATFAAVDDSTPPEQLADALRANVAAVIADPAVQREILIALSSGISGAGAGASGNTTERHTSAAAAPDPAAAYTATLARLLGEQAAR